MAKSDPKLVIEEVALDKLTPYARNAKLHPAWQVAQIAESIDTFGNCDPIGVWTNADGQLEIVEGHGRALALEKLGHTTAPIIRLDHLTDEERRAYALVHNQTTMNTDLDADTLQGEIYDLPDFDWANLGFQGSADLDPDDVDMSDIQHEKTDINDQPSQVCVAAVTINGQDHSLISLVKLDDNQEQKLQEVAHRLSSEQIAERILNAISSL